MPESAHDSLALALSLLHRKLQEYDRDGVSTKEVWNLTQIAKALPVILKAQKDSDDPLEEMNDQELLTLARKIVDDQATK